MKQLEEMAVELDHSNDYKVLRRLKGFDFLSGLAQREKTYKGMYVDVEATGLDTDKDEVIELAAWEFQFTGDGRITDLAEPLHYYSQPRKPINAEITKLTGITAEMVAGKSIDVVELEKVVSGVDLIVAHHAGYDRQMLERVSASFAKKCWGCSMSEPPWSEHGIAGKRLEYILAAMGRFYDAHNATTDCHAGLFTLSQELGSTGKTALSYVLDSARAVSWHVWALRAPFEVKDALKARGYFWNGGEDGRPECWHKEIPDADRAAEEKWLAGNIYRGARMGLDGSYELPARFDKVTAYERFSKRG